MVDISLVVPVYKEEANIRLFLVRAWITSMFNTFLIKNIYNLVPYHL